MKKILISCLFLITFVIGCTVVNDRDTIIPTLLSTDDFSAVATLESTQTPIEPSQTSSTALPVLPSLAEKEAYNLLFDMLKSEDACELPCWLNITPGKSSLSEVYFAWAPLQGITATYTDFPAAEEGDMDFIYKKDNYNLKIFTSYSVANSTGVIDSINAFTEVTHDLGNSEFEYTFTADIYKSALSKYLLSSVLSTYGLPNQILLNMEIIISEPTSPDFFHIWLFYSANGAILEYTGSVEVINDVILFCPSDSIVSLWLVPLNSAEIFQNTLEEATGLPSSHLYKSTEDAIGMTKEEFYNEFKKSDSSCVESPLDIWPEP